MDAIGSSIVDPAIGEAGDVDTAVVTLHFADGRIARDQEISRRAVYGYDQRIELPRLRGSALGRQHAREHRGQGHASGVTSAKPEFFFLERYMRAYASEWSAFVEAVISGSPVPVTLDDGVNALALAEAAAMSAKTGQTVSLASVLS